VIEADQKSGQQRCGVRKAKENIADAIQVRDRTQYRYLNDTRVQKDGLKIGK
jgi:hypothetical protein